ncbi:MAG: hypothetical protein K6E95_01690 [Lachnospiraceae bacterium]|nr:hypothetical protein [Lachnospiraceae bacterium]
MYKDNIINIKGRQGNPTGNPAEPEKQTNISSNGSYMRYGEKDPSRQSSAASDNTSPKNDAPIKKKKHKKRNPFSVSALFLFAVIVYLVVNLIMMSSRDKISIYEVKAAQLSYDTTFSGIAVRDERIVFSDYSGYISYFVRNKKKSAKNSIIYCVDSMSNSYNTLKKDFVNEKLDKSQIKEIKSSIARYLEGDSSTIIGNVGDFKEQLDSMIYDFVSNNMIENLKGYVENENTSGRLHVCQTPYSGVVSFKYDAYNGITTEMVTADMFDTAPDVVNLRSTGLIAQDDPVYRICGDENWAIVCKVTEDFYVDNVGTREAKVLIGNKTTPVTVTTTPYSIGTDYFVEIKLNNYMSEFIDDRLLSVRFINKRDEGLKIPISSIVQKQFYLCPLNMFVQDKDNKSAIMKEEFDPESGEIILTPIYPTKFYSDGYYAYIDPLYVSEGDIINNPDTGNRIIISSTNSLDGVYNVNKAIYQFVRIERLETGSDYVIISPSTPDGIREYDHIALDGSKGKESDLIL